MDPAGTSPDSKLRTESCNDEQCSIEPVTTDYAVQQLEAKIVERNSKGWRRIVINFTPSWFAVTMGTGICATLLHNMPFGGQWLRILAIIVFCLDIVLFLLFLAVTVLRFIMFPGIFTAVLRHPVMSLFLGTIPMSLSQIINLMVLICVPVWKDWVLYFAWGLWWFDVFLSLATAFYLPFIIIHVHQQELSKMTATWLLPIVTTIVASGSGGLVAEVLPPQYALWTIVTSYILWGVGFPLSLMVLTMYFHRLTIHHLPSREVIVSVFLPLGPIAQGSFALMQLGKVANKVFPVTDTYAIDAGPIFFAVGHMIALSIWGFGLVWLFFAVASITRSRFPFNMGWWGFVFPLGVYAVSTCTLGEHLPSLFFKVLGTIFSVIVVGLWLAIGLQTTRRAITGQIFFSPCAEPYQRNLAMKMVRKVKKSPEQIEMSAGRESV